jgi:hypothetical protein
LVVACAGVLIEIAILPTRGIVLPGDAAVIGVFGIVARPRALGIFRVLELIAVVVEAIPASIDLALAGARFTNGSG